MTHRLLALLLTVLFPAAANAHGLNHTVETTDAVSITITHTDGAPLSGASYRVTSPDATRPVMTGATDVLGRLHFVPDRDGDWSIEVWTPDGHGLQTTIPWTAVDGAATASADTPTTVPLVGTRLLVGVVVAGIAGFLIGRRRQGT